MLWLGSRGGLTRFDGDRFVDVELAPQVPRSRAWARRVLAASDGSVWVATGAGALSFAATGPGAITAEHGQPAAFLRLLPYAPAERSERIHLFTGDEGLPNPWVWALAEQPAGTIWVGTEQGLMRLGEGKPRTFSTAEGLPGAFVTALAVAPDGRLIAGTSRGVAVRIGDRFVPTAVIEPVRAVAADRAGRIWAIARDTLLRLDAQGRLQRFDAPQAEALAVDDDDNLWVGPPLAVYGRGEAAPLRLPKDFDPDVTALLGDRDGALWLPRRTGRLDRISVPPVRNYGLPEGLPGETAFTVLGTGDGSVFVTTGKGISRRAADGSWTHWRNGPAIGLNPRDLAEGPAGKPNAGLWLASDGLLRAIPGGFHTVLASKLPTSRDEYGFRSVIAAHDGDLWVAEWPTGLLHYAGAEVRRPPTVIGPKDGLCGANLTHGVEAPDGALWFGLYYGSPGTGATRVKDGRARCYGAADGLPAGQIGAVGIDGEGTIWLGTGWGHGLVRFREGRFAVIAPALGLPATSITGIIDDGRGSLWVGSESGVWRLSKAELHRCADGACPGLHPTVFGKEQGMRTAECTGAFHPNITLDQRGDVWVATLWGASAIHPQKREPSSPLPVVEAILVDDIPVDPAEPLRLGPRQRQLSVRYAAPFLGTGSRPLLRHRLLGVDQDWVLGVPAIAHYQDLTSGRYTLELQAGSGPLTRLGVVVAPPFWRSPAFLAGAAVALAAAALLFRRARLARLRLRHYAVSEERARIARDLHDGLAQKLTALGMLTDRLRQQREEGGAALGPELGQIRKIARDAHAELRQAIWDSREVAEEWRLKVLIENALADVRVPPETELTLTCGDHSQPVGGLAAHEVPLVIQEAVTNAVRHARARHIEVTVLSDDEALHAWVRDDGCGLPADERPDRAGHYGIVGMHERARRLGGVLSVLQRREGGTEVALFVPRGRAREP
jgi:signal transduction histidine kinase/ligand-binding sensor domain-containing protein